MYPEHTLSLYYSWVSILPTPPLPVLLSLLPLPSLTPFSREHVSLQTLEPSRLKKFFLRFSLWRSLLFLSCALLGISPLLLSFPFVCVAGLGVCGA